MDYVAGHDLVQKSIDDVSSRASLAVVIARNCSSVWCSHEGPSSNCWRPRRTCGSHDGEL
eukprot:scaffold3551_cov408-Prasinococcus_capsulatus_cf.AAC.20